MIVYNCYLHELFILQSYISSVRKKKKKQKFAFFSSVFAQKLQEIRFMIPKKRKKMTLQNARSSYLLNFRMWFKNGLKAQKLLAQGIALGIMVISKAP